MSALDRSDLINYDFYGSGESLEGIVHADTASVKSFIKAPYTYFGRFLWQPAAVKAAKNGKYDAIILLADPNFLSTWAASIISKFKGTPVIFWGHGWLKPEGIMKRLVRKAYFKLSDTFLIYGERGKLLGISAGFPSEKITVVYNSLDVDKANEVISRIDAGTLNNVVPQNFFADPSRPLVICTARLTSKCRFDILFEAAAILKTNNLDINILLVGEGPERANLERLAQKLGINAHFFGACYEEETTGQLIYGADLTVSPGKIGLTAMHSLMYGTPAITHCDFDEQMPEVEAIQDGCTGSFFRRGDHNDLANVIQRWLEQARPRNEIRAAARAEILKKWTPTVQANIIQDTVLRVTKRG